QALLMMEFLLHGLAEHSQLSKKPLDKGLLFKDLMSGMLNFHEGFEEDDEFE
ncbi:MAG: magnesium chelatase, partial [Bacteroidia bacterium]|nr:magnesium chelatase [Bacteroidia bacterium]